MKFEAFLVERLAPYNVPLIVIPNVYGKKRNFIAERLAEGHYLYLSARNDLEGVDYGNPYCLVDFLKELSDEGDLPELWALTAWLARDIRGIYPIFNYDEIGLTDLPDVYLLVVLELCDDLDDEILSRLDEHPFNLGPQLGLFDFKEWYGDDEDEDDEDDEYDEYDEDEEESKIKHIEPIMD